MCDQKSHSSTNNKTCKKWICAEKFSNELHRGGALIILVLNNILVLFFLMLAMLGLTLFNRFSAKFIYSFRFRFATWKLFMPWIKRNLLIHKKISNIVFHSRKNWWYSIRYYFTYFTLQWLDCMNFSGIFFRFTAIAI